MIIRSVLLLLIALNGASCAGLPPGWTVHYQDGRPYVSDRILPAASYEMQAT
jgi:hypothetical protein